MFRGIDFNVPNLFSDVTIPSVSVIELLNRFVFVILKTFDVRGRADGSFVNGCSDPKIFRDFRESDKLTLVTSPKCVSRTLKSMRLILLYKVMGLFRYIKIQLDGEAVSTKRKES